METVTAEDLERMRENDDEFTLVDVLGEDHYNEMHIPGAVNIPLDQIASEALDRFEKDDRIVVYCANTDCGASPKAAEKLEKLGFTNVADFEAGLQGWKDAGREVSG